MAISIYRMSQLRTTKYYEQNAIILKEIILNLVNVILSLNM